MPTFTVTFRPADEAATTADVSGVSTAREAAAFVASRGAGLILAVVPKADGPADRGLRGPDVAAVPIDVAATIVPDAAALASAVGDLDGIEAARAFAHRAWEAASDRKGDPDFEGPWEMKGGSWWAARAAAWWAVYTDLDRMAKLLGGRSAAWDPPLSSVPAASNRYGPDIKRRPADEH